MNTNRKTAPTLKKEQQERLESFTATSQKIRYLLAEGYSRGDVSRILNIRYQWVRNVEITPLKKA